MACPIGQGGRNNVRLSSRW